MKKIKYIVLILVVLLQACNSNLKKEYYANGSLKSKYYCDKYGLKYGSFIKFDTDGKKISEFNYINDTLNGIGKEYHPNGRLATVVNFKNGLQDGFLVEYYSNGNLLQHTEYKLGTRFGLAKFYYQNGVVQTLSYSKNDETQYKIKYDSLGNVTDKQYLIDFSILNKLTTTDSIKIRIKLCGFYDMGKNPVFSKIDNYSNVKEGLYKIMTFNELDSCYYYTFVPQKNTDKYIIKIRSLISQKFNHMLDTVITITR